VALVLVALRRPSGDPFWFVLRGSIVGCAVLLLVANNPQGYRLELVFVPAIAAGFALALAYLLPLARGLGVAQPRSSAE
jgi:hypothetical protein